MAELLSTALDIKSLIDRMTDEEKKQALALLQGMMIGKELKTATEKPA